MNFVFRVACPFASAVLLISLFVGALQGKPTSLVLLVPLCVLLVCSSVAFALPPALSRQRRHLIKTVAKLYCHYENEPTSVQLPKEHKSGYCEARAFSALFTDYYHSAKTIADYFTEVSFVARCTGSDFVSSDFKFIAAVFFAYYEQVAKLKQSEYFPGLFSHLPRQRKQVSRLWKKGCEEYNAGKDMEFCNKVLKSNEHT